MTLSTLSELQAQFDALTARITALDRDIALETDNERRTVARERRAELASERATVAADIELMQHGGRKAHSTETVTIETRIMRIERDLHLLWSMLKPGPRQVVSRLVFYVLLLGLWSMWMVKEIRDWLIMHPAQAIVITVAVFLAALIIRWLPEDDYDQR